MHVNVGYWINLLDRTTGVMMFESGRVGWRNSTAEDKIMGPTSDDMTRLGLETG